MLRVRLARRRVARAGDGQGDQAGPLVSQRVQHRAGVVRGEEVVGDHAHHPGLVGLGPSDHHGVEVVLLTQHLPHLRAVQSDAHHTPVGGDAASPEVVEEHRLVGPVETADADVDDGRRELGAVVGGDVHRCAEVRERVLAQRGGSVEGTVVIRVVLLSAGLARSGSGCSRRCGAVPGAGKSQAVLPP